MVTGAFEMNVKELKIIEGFDIIKLIKTLSGFRLTINGQDTYLSETAAALIYLYLKENLKLHNE